MKTIHYFSDGCATQYKTCKHFVNLCHQLTDFSIDCMWNFFATSHGKSPCDGICGTVKRVIARTNLQCPISSQILSAKTMFEFCQGSIHRINFIYTSFDEIDVVQSKLTSWFSLARTIPGTRSYHQFVHTSTFSIKMKRVSDDNEFESEFNFLGKHTPVQNPCLDQIKILTYLLCKYNDWYWIGIVSDTDEAVGDVKVKFMYPHYPGVSFFWPSQDDVCWVPHTHIITIIQTPLLSSASAWQNTISKSDICTIKSLIQINVGSS